MGIRASVAFQCGSALRLDAEMPRDVVLQLHKALQRAKVLERDNALQRDKLRGARAAIANEVDATFAVSMRGFIENEDIGVFGSIAIAAAAADTPLGRIRRAPPVESTLQPAIHELVPASRGDDPGDGMMRRPKRHFVELFTAPIPIGSIVGNAMA